MAVHPSTLLLSGYAGKLLSLQHWFNFSFCSFMLDSMYIALSEWMLPLCSSFFFQNAAGGLRHCHSVLVKLWRRKSPELGTQLQQRAPGSLRQDRSCSIYWNYQGRTTVLLLKWGAGKLYYFCLHRVTRGLIWSVFLIAVVECRDITFSLH